MSSFFTRFLRQALIQISYVLRKVTSCSTFCLTKVPTESCGLHLPPLIDEVYETGKKYIIREESEAKVHLFSVGKNNEYGNKRPSQRHQGATVGPMTMSLMR